MFGLCFAGVLAALPLVGVVTVEHPLLSRSFQGLPLEAELAPGRLLISLWGLQCGFAVGDNSERLLTGTCRVSRDGFTVEARIENGSVTGDKLQARLLAHVTRRAAQEVFGEVVSVDVPLGDARVAFEGQILAPVAQPAVVAKQPWRPTPVRPARSRCRLFW